MYRKFEQVKAILLGVANDTCRRLAFIHVPRGSIHSLEASEALGPFCFALIRSSSTEVTSIVRAATATTSSTVAAPRQEPYRSDLAPAYDNRLERCKSWKLYNT